MNRYHQQIAQVWKNNLTEQEKKDFLEDFSKHEQQWKASLAGEYLQHLEDDLQQLPQEKSDEILEMLHTAIREKISVQAEKAPGKVRAITPVIKWVAAAAILVALITVFYPYNRKQENGSAAVTKVQPPVAKLTLQTNNTKNNLAIQLQDGSQVTLSPGSAITYYTPYINNKRDISLQGQAWFKVAKDPTRPFTVYANNITTTALGTEFMVNTRVNDKVEIRLYEGKIVIRSVDSALAMKDVLLSPGQIFNLDKQLKQYTIKLFKDSAIDDNKAVEKTIVNSRIAPVTALVFEQQPLQEVLLQIGKRYHVEFIYDSVEIANIQVTGKFLPSDSLQTVLSILGTVNGLSFTVQKNIITVSKVK